MLRSRKVRHDQDILLIGYCSKPRYYMLLAMIQNREGDAKTALTTLRKVLAMPEMPKRRLEQLAERKQASDLMAEFQKM